MAHGEKKPARPISGAQPSASFNLLRLYQMSPEGGVMNQIAAALMAEFADENGLTDLSESEQFEHMASFLALRRHYSRSLDTLDVVSGAGGDTGLDAIGVIVNGMLITDVDQIQEMLELNGYIQATFIFVQAERSEGYDSGKVLKIGAGVKDFFSDKPKLPRNEKVSEFATFSDTIYEHSNHFRKGNPSCIVYYITTGKTADAPEISANIKSVKEDLDNTSLFGEIRFHTLGASEIQHLTNQVKYAIEKKLTFKEHVELPKVEGVETAFLGYVPAPDFIELISDDARDAIRGSLFYDNVRDWQNYNEVNDEMRGTLTSDAPERFVLMNNGVTIIARKLGQAGREFTIEDFRIVNGCQTSNVIFDQRDNLGEEVMVPLRLISTDDEEVVEAIVRGTNRQTELKPEQFYALNEFSRTLEEFYRTRPEDVRLYYERRDGQYDRMAITKSKIISPQVQIKAFASMFLKEPHVAAKNYRSLRDEIGQRFFVKDHKLEPYFVSALSAYHLELQYRSQKIDATYKSARFHMLLAARLLMDSQKLPFLNSRAMQDLCAPMINRLSDQDTVDKMFQDAKNVIDQVSDGDLSRDAIRTIGTTKAIIDLLEN